MKRVQKTTALAAVCFILLLSAGCAQTINGWEIEQGEKFCTDHRGVDQYETLFGAYVRCNDGTGNWFVQLKGK